MNKVELIAQQLNNSINVRNIWGDIIINVKESPYNAIGNGVKDDTVAIQKAVNYANSIGKHDIWMPPGTYKYTTISNTGNITFYGDYVNLVGVTFLEVVSFHSMVDRIDNIVAGAGSSNTEIVDARLPATGSSYPTLKIRLDTENANVNASIAAHEADTTAHNATAIVFTPAGSGISATNVDGAIKEQESRIDNLIIHGDSGPEAADARMSSPYGVTYPTLKDRVDHTDTEAIALRADIAYNVKDAGCLTNDTADCGSLLNSLVGKNYIYFPEGTYRFTTTWNINDNFTTVIFHPKAKIHVLGNVTAIDINADYCRIMGGEIYSDGITANNGRYGINVDGSYCVIENTYIHDITFTAIFNNGKYNTFRDNLARNVGWDAGSNYSSTLQAKWINCRAFNTGRHGFSTDTGAQLVDFIDCYTEDIGNPSLNEGHDPYHYEGCIGGSVINCSSKWTVNSGYVTNAGTSSVRLGIRITGSFRIVVNGLRIVIDVGFVPVDTARLFNWCYVESTSVANSTILMRNVVITNNSNFVTKAYLGLYSSLELEKCIFYGYVSAKQESVAGAIRSIKDCFIDGVDKSYYFYDHPYQTIGFQASSNVIKNSKGLINGGQLINALFEKNVFENCYDAILLGRYSGNGCLNTIIRQNYIKTIDHYAIQGSYNATAQQVKIIENLFDGVIANLFVGEAGGCNALWKNNQPGSTLAVTTLVTGSATSILTDMTSNYDVVRDGATVRPANPDTSGATLVQLETEVNEIKAAMRIARLIF